tara:strand:- start:59 stop:706 length:648 start_codon:yes stop_codon:yes gene_type:complete
MIVKNTQQDIIFDTKKTKIGMKISGGADSAIVLYMLSKYVTENNTGAKIIPITVNHEGKDYQEQFAKQVVAHCKEVFGDIFEQHQTARNYTPDTYASTQQDLVESLYENNIIECHYVGITRDPPKDIVNTFGLKGPADDRSPGQHRQQVLDNRIYRPLINIDKKGVAELYDTFAVMDTLFPLTRSCEEFTSNFSKHCETGCWFCQERYWGFGRYV